MAINAVCSSFKLEFLQGIHVFGTDTIKLALYSNSATIDQNTTAYTTSGELVGGNYTAGGKILTLQSGFPKLNPSPIGEIPAGKYTLLNFEDCVFVNLSAPSIGCGLIYNASKENRAICVLDFGGNYQAGGIDFRVDFPEGDGINSIIRVS